MEEVSEVYDVFPNFSDKNVQGKCTRTWNLLPLLDSWHPPHSYPQPPELGDAGYSPWHHFQIFD